MRHRPKIHEVVMVRGKKTRPNKAKKSDTPEWSGSAKEYDSVIHGKSMGARLAEAAKGFEVGASKWREEIYKSLRSSAELAGTITTSGSYTAEAEGGMRMAKRKSVATVKEFEEEVRKASSKEDTEGMEAESVSVLESPLLATRTEAIYKELVSPSTFDSPEDLLTATRDKFVKFFNKHGKAFRVRGPHQFTAHQPGKEGVSKGRWKKVSCLGDEYFSFHDVRFGDRDGLIIQWTATGLAGLSDDAVIETVIWKDGNELSPDTTEDMFKRPTLRTMLGAFLKGVDLASEAKELREEVVKAEKAARIGKLKDQKEYYGGGFGTWG